MSTFKRYLGIQAMIFVFGIVGPIFLIIFFASQPDPNMKWAYWFGLFITYADVMIALALTASTGDKEKAPTDVRVALAVAKRLQANRGFVVDIDPSSD
ncbi:hypothetical protein BST27_25600 [Mycobacterium intermedium]|uniref:Uncharacterized protein n=1 Tax=Mycobacterium intermedium TaxID=28445 RepID=A0A1E3S4Z7_MYCIE|nr:hypothetical protein [Mycobacterium intermedium]MCV6966915.1 hypothetical protein [Mycobacterium intermedium]ODQ97253.1 hypothetical protein BHQ20_27120 [Mycobacterium intermedium]OPE47422.1 hypothetical protein BV508_22175 [Mycobacterium intermedium]ORA96451.1 hypothetical protein BST27_25600 [Mycobacterium intermedium]